MVKILVADDEYSICQAFSEFLELEGYTSLVASNGKEALELLLSEKPDLVFLDYQMPGMDGLQTLEKIRSVNPRLPVVLMTAYGTMHTAIDAVRNGAFDYIGKPVELSQIRDLVRRALHNAEEKLSKIDERFRHDMAGEQELVGNSPAMQEIFKLIGLLTTNDLNVLITGQSGVGKELVARAIHNHGARRDAPFIAVNCAAIPENLIESELFGHERGAYTGAEGRRIGKLEAAQDGVIFFDEISELPLHRQSKLLRVLQEKTFERVGGNLSIKLRARVISATNKSLEQEVRQNRFREDLYHRLHLVNLRIPPLRERKEDIGSLAHYFLARASRELDKPVTGIEERAIHRLESYAWPGNVRELEHTIRRAVLMLRGDVLSIHDLQLGDDQLGEPAEPLSEPVDELLKAARSSFLAEISNPGSEPPSVFHKLVFKVEKTLVEEALRVCDNNQVAASRLLGLNRTTLRKKLGDLGSDDNPDETPGSEVD